MFQKIQEVAKFVVAIATVIVTAGVGLIPGEFIGWVQLGIAIVGAVAVYGVPNKTPGDHAA